MRPQNEAVQRLLRVSLRLPTGIFLFGSVSFKILSGLRRLQALMSRGCLHSELVRPIKRCQRFLPEVRLAQMGLIWEEVEATARGETVPLQVPILGHPLYQVTQAVLYRCHH